MSFISYAQNFEDAMLWRALKHVKNGFYIDVGANDPIQDSVTKGFYENGWRGINIEPVSQWFEKLQKERPRDINLQLAAGRERGELLLYEIPDTGLSTLEKTIAQRHESERGFKNIERKVNVWTLTEICFAYHVAPIHFLNIDVEGTGKQVLEGLDFSKIRPWIILMESTLPNTQTDAYEDWEPILLAAGYHNAYSDGLNRFYVAEEHNEISISFKTPPNCFDDFFLNETQHFCRNIAMRTREVQTALSEQQSRSLQLQAECDAERNKTQEVFARLKEAQTSLSEQQSQFLRLQAECDAERNKTQEAYARLEELSGELSVLRSADELKKKQLKEKTETLARIREILDNQKTQMMQLNACNHQFNAERDAAQAKADELSQLLQSVLTSKSWRLTEPLRKLMLRLRKPSSFPSRISFQPASLAEDPDRRLPQEKELTPAAAINSSSQSQNGRNSLKPKAGAVGNGSTRSDSDFSFLTPWAHHIYGELRAAAAQPLMRNDISISILDARVNTQVGEKTSATGLISTSKPGWLMFGPYLRLDPGKYRAVIFGKLMAGSGESVRFDVAHSKGEKILAQIETKDIEIRPSGGNDILATMEFSLVSPVEDLEVRAHVGSKTSVAITHYQLSPIE
jgi:FkbM family methyltransferase